MDVFGVLPPPPPYSPLVAGRTKIQKNSPFKVNVKKVLALIILKPI
jgi:hypothetical protein